MATQKSGAADLRAILTRLETTVTTIQQLRQQLGVATPGTPPGLATALHNAFVGYSVSNVSPFAEVILHPIADNAVWVDMPTLQRHKVTATSPAAWKTAFPDFKEEVVNTFGNEGWLVVERRAKGTHRGSLRVGNDTVPASGRTFAIDSADVVKFENGQAVQIEHYYDMAGVLRSLGLMTGPPIGHDEHGATLPAVLHASGFLQPSDDMRVAATAAGAAQGKWPVKIGEPKKMGRSNSAAAQRNVKNCSSIHEAFITHTPDRFSDLIDVNAIWIDVPTGEVLNGAIAAAHHDHGNWQTAFPDSTAEVTNMVANDDWVAVQHRGYGSHSGPLQLAGKTYPATGRKVDIRVLDIVQYRSGRAILVRNYYDMGMLLVQLGIVPQ